MKILAVFIGLTNSRTGWISQNKNLVENLKPIDGFITEDDINSVKSDWLKSCENIRQHLLIRRRDLLRHAVKHRDSFEAILPVLDSDNPLKEYIKISDEILRRFPDRKLDPYQAALASRSFLMIRLGLHLGVRQKNLRQLLFCDINQKPRSEVKLSQIKRGELRWNQNRQLWHVFIPTSAFKNSNSSFFCNKPFELYLPNVGNLYRHISDYINIHRPIILGASAKANTFFVVRSERRPGDGEFTQAGFYECWRKIIRRYGIFNPYTGQGAIEGLLPHGPHSVRDVIVTHILKMNGSVDQAAYAIQDTRETILKCYARFLPKNKTALAAKVLDEIWT